jgi:hypothetical protein
MNINIGEYSVVKKLGSGGLADVFEASSPDGKHVAIKLLREPERGGAYVRRFLREGRLLMRFEHSGLPRCYDVVDCDRPYIVLELLVGDTLGAVVRRNGGVGAEKIVKLATKMLNVLEFLHGNGVIHRDVKPNNVFVCDDGRYMLMDLGLAGDVVDPLTTTLGDVMGTYAYMAPEQIAGAETDRRADLYSLGVTLFECIVGKRPFGTIGAAATLQAQRQEGAASVGELAPLGTPERLIEVVSQLMSWDPSGRPESAGVALAVLTGHVGRRQDLALPQMVGRSGPLGAIEAVLDIGGCIRFVGEIGMGCGTVAQAAWKMAAKRNFEIISVRCRNVGAGANVVAQITNAVTILVGEIGEDSTSLCSELKNLHQEHGVLLLIENLELATPQDVREIVELIDNLEIPTILTDSVGEYVLPCRIIRLRALTLNEVSKLVGGMLSGASVPDGLAMDLHRTTGGLPAAVVAGVRDLHTRNMLYFFGVGDDGGAIWRMSGAVELRSGAVIQRMAEQLNARLSCDARAIVDVMAVFGGACPTEVLLAVSGVSDDSVAPFELLSQRIVSEPKRGWLELRSGPLAGVWGANVEKRREVEIHRMYVLELEGVEDSRWRTEHIKYHSAMAVDGDGSAQALVDLGAWLVENGAPNRGLIVLDKASRESHLDPNTAAVGALARGQALISVGLTALAVEAFYACKRLAQSDTTSRVYTRSCIELADVCVKHGHLERASNSIAEASAAVSLDESDKIRLGITQGLLHLCEGELVTARKTMEELPTLSLSPYLIGKIEGVLAKVDLAEGKVEPGLKGLRKWAEQCSRTGSTGEHVEALYHVVSANIRLGRLSDALQAVHLMGRLVRNKGILSYNRMTTVAAAKVDIASGLVQQGRGRLRALGDLDNAQTIVRLDFIALRGQVRVLRGDFPAALAAHYRGASEAKDAGWQARYHFHRAVSSILTGRGVELEVALKWLSDRGESYLVSHVLGIGAKVGGDPELLALAVRHAEQAGDIFQLIDALRCSGGEENRERALEVANAVLSASTVEQRAQLLNVSIIKWALGG